MSPAPNDGRRDGERSLREDNWENEGGHLSGARPVTPSPIISINGVEWLEVEVGVRKSTLSRDFANGRVGMRYNSYAHRSRVLRQQEAELDALRKISVAEKTVVSAPSELDEEAAAVEMAR